MTASAFASEVNIPADRDTTLIEDTEGDLANGAGPNLFVGHTNQAEFGIRRGLLRFDVAAALPGNAIIDGVSLRLYQNSSNPKPGTVTLHRVLDDWGEGKSSKTGGRGAPAEQADATWLHTFYDHRHWSHPGGHYIADVNTTAVVNDKNLYIWKSTDSLVNDVRLWLHETKRNYGWLLMGDENTRGSVKRFASREALAKDQQPLLTIEYHLAGEDAVPPGNN